MPQMEPPQPPRMNAADAVETEDERVTSVNASSRLAHRRSEKSIRFRFISKVPLRIGLRYPVCSTFTTVAFDFSLPVARKYRLRDTMHKILVVDDTEDARDVLARLLRLGGFSTVTAEDGIEAIKALEMDHPDLVLLD